MPALTVPAVRKYVAQAKRREIRDSLAPGLHLVIQPTGVKSWAMRFRRPDGRPAKLTIGRVDLGETETTDGPVVGGTLTLRQARQLANEIDRARARGEDVVGVHRADRLRRRAEAESQSDGTFLAAATEFFRDHRTKWGARPRRWRADARVLGLDWPRDADPGQADPRVRPGGLADLWRDRALTEIDANDVHVVVDDARKRGIPGLPSSRRVRGNSEARARALHSGLAVFFRWCLRRRRIATNPLDGVWRPSAPSARDRVLMEHEVQWLWRACDRLDPFYGAAFRLLLITGCRLSEVAGMRRAELSGDSARWTIPSGRAKNHREHVVPLPPLARAVLDDVPMIEGEFVFTTTGRGPLTSFSTAKKQLDEAMLAVAREERADLAAIPPWRLHDLRRTCATGMAELDIAPHIIEACLNHVSGARAGVAGIYNRAAYGPQKQAALERWAAHLDGLVSGRSAVVVPLRG